MHFAPFVTFSLSPFPSPSAPSSRMQHIKSCHLPRALKFECTFKFTSAVDAFIHEAKVTEREKKRHPYTSE